VLDPDSSWKIPVPITLPLRSVLKENMYEKFYKKKGVSPELVVFIEFFALQFV